MSEPEFILVPTDFEAPSDRALVQARELAAKLGTELCLVHVTPSASALVAVRAEPSFADRIAHARAALEERAAAAGGALTLLGEGDPARAILAAIDEVRPSLVVMATHGRRGLSRLVMGSVAEEVLRKSSVPVMTVNGRALGIELPPADSAVLVPLDFGEPSEHASALAGELRRRLGGEVIFLHVNQLVSANPEMGNVYVVVAETDLREARQSLEEHADSVGGARTLVREGDPATEILAAIEEVRPRFVVMGTHGRGGFARAALGSVAEQVVRASSVPVVTVRSAAVLSRAAHAAA